jgi:hypothetical protein
MPNIIIINSYNIATHTHIYIYIYILVSAVQYTHIIIHIIYYYSRVFILMELLVSIHTHTHTFTEYYNNNIHSYCIVYTHIITVYIIYSDDEDDLTTAGARDGTKGNLCGPPRRRRRHHSDPDRRHVVI